MVFPNPAVDHIEIQCSQSPGLKWTITDIYGKTIAEGNQTIIATSQLKSGVYFLNISHSRYKFIIAQ